VLVANFFVDVLIGAARTRACARASSPKGESRMLKRLLRSPSFVCGCTLFFGTLLLGLLGAAATSGWTWSSVSVWPTWRRFSGALAGH